MTFSIGLLWYSFFVLIKVQTPETYSGQELNCTIKLSDFPDKHEKYTKYTGYIRIQNKKVKATIYDYNAYTRDFYPGDILLIDASLNTVGFMDRDRSDYLLANGVYLTGKMNSYATLISSGTVFSGLPKRINRVIGLIVDYTFPEDVSHFLCSLMIGDKNKLYSDEALHTALSNAGLMHIVAVSGMHVSFLVGCILSVLGNSRASRFISIIIIAIFVFVTGAGPSVLRAGFMHVFILLAPVFRRENDSITSLSFALAVLLLLNPFSAKSISLQLSFGATAGIILFSNRINEFLCSSLKIKKSKKFFNSLLSVFSCSVGAMIFTVPMMAIHFGTIQVLAPLTNCLTLWAVSICFSGAYLSSIVALFIPVLGRIIAIPISVLARYIIIVARFVSSIDYSYIYAAGLIPAVWLIAIYVVSIAVCLSKHNAKVKLIFISLYTVVSYSILVIVISLQYYNYAGVFSIIDVGQGQCLALIDRSETVVIDCGSVDKRNNPSQIAVKYLKSHGRNDIDVLILTHLHSDHANGVKMLLSSIRVHSIIIPAGLVDEDKLLNEILAASEETNTDIFVLSSNLSFSLDKGSTVVNLYAPISSGEDENESCICLSLNIDGYRILVTADSSAEAEERLVKTYNIRDIDLLVVGHHGSRYSSSDLFLEQISPEISVISVGENIFGHPTQDTLSRLSEIGSNIFRTDIDGTVEIKIG